MLDNLNPHNDGERSSERAHRSPSSEARPVADREVPLSRRTTPAQVHAWLDGELPESAVRPLYIMGNMPQPLGVFTWDPTS